MPIGRTRDPDRGKTLQSFTSRARRNFIKLLDQEYCRWAIPATDFQSIHGVADDVLVQKDGVMEAPFVRLLMLNRGDVNATTRAVIASLNCRSSTVTRRGVSRHLGGVSDIRTGNQCKESAFSVPPTMTPFSPTLALSMTGC